jgi:hypothetical protein
MLNTLTKEEQEISKLGANKAKSSKQAFWMYEDANERSKEAIKGNPKFISKSHLSKIDDVQKCLEKYFGPIFDFYENQRPGGNGRTPMTILKPTNDYMSLSRNQRLNILDDLKKLNTKPEITTLKSKYVLKVGVPVL